MLWNKLRTTRLELRSFISRKRSAFIVIGIYIVSILAFAVLYTCWSGDFYHPYVTRERPVIAEYNQIREIVEGCLLKSLNDRLKPPLTVDSRVSYVRDFTVDSENIHLSLRLFVFDTTLNRGVLLTLPIRMSITGAVGTSKTNVWEAGVTSDENPPPPNSWKSNDYFPELWPVELESRKQEIVSTIVNSLQNTEIPSTFLTRVHDYFSATLGFPNRMPRSFERMMYFSAITITTVGYGDIVPMSDRARSACAIEATWGIIVLGMFVSACTSRRDPSKELASFAGTTSPGPPT